jgi:hypothetical protein
MGLTYSSVVRAEPDEVFAWHSRPGAITRLVPSRLSAFMRARSRIFRLPGSVGKVAADVRGCRGARAQDPLADGQQGSELVAGLDRIPRLPARQLLPGGWASDRRSARPRVASPARITQQAAPRSRSPEPAAPLEGEGAGDRAPGEVADVPGAMHLPRASSR